MLDHDTTALRDTALRERARERIEKRGEFWSHLAVYVLVNGFLTAIWAVVSPDAIFWPMFPIFGWGIGLVMHAWEVFLSPDISETAIDREVARMTRRVP